MVDPERLVAILSRVTARLRILEGYRRHARGELLADRVRMSDVKYTLQTAIEACIDAAHHVIADQGLTVPASNADAFRSLAASGIIDAGVATTMAGAVGVRNVLVHGYADVDDGLVLDHLDHLDDLRALVAALARLLEAPDDRPPR